MARLSDFSVLSFDCYGTLIDWERGILEALDPWLHRVGLVKEPDQVLESFARCEAAQEAETPSMVYSAVLARVCGRLALEWHVDLTEDEAESFGRSVRHWPAFPDSAEALAYLQRHYRLVILSNVDRESFRWSNDTLGVEFHRVFTAEEIGSYKPDPRNFEYMLRELARDGFGRNEILHTAQSLFHDHVPAGELGLSTAWIDRRHDRPGWGATSAPSATPQVDLRFESMADLVEGHRAEVGST